MSYSTPWVSPECFDAVDCECDAIKAATTVRVRYSKGDPPIECGASIPATICQRCGRIAWKSFRADPMGMAPISLEQFNQDRTAFWMRNGYGQHRTGIACPKCGAEMMDSTPGEVLTTFPGQVRVMCGCGYRGLRIE